MADSLDFRLEFEATAAVVRSCCGQDHEFGPCPNQDKEKAA